MVETEGGRDWRNDRMKAKGIPGELAGKGGYKRGQSMEPLNVVKRRTTAGWQPTCGHDEPPVPCLVLDPFMGSGTTAMVAQDLGRRWLGVELNRDYEALQHERTQQLGLLAHVPGSP